MAIAIILGKVIVPMFILIGHVPSGSMEPTLQIKDTVFCSNVFWNVLEHGDIVVFKPNEEENTDDEYFIKRLIGLPGDKIKIEHGKVYRNGEELDEPYVKSKLDYTGSFTVPQGRYFVLGDNRGDSLDARYWSNPFLEKSQIDYVGEAVILPFRNFTVFED